MRETQQQRRKKEKIEVLCPEGRRRIRPAPPARAGGRKERENIRRVISRLTCSSAREALAYSLGGKRATAVTLIFGDETLGISISVELSCPSFRKKVKCPSRAGPPLMTVGNKKGMAFSLPGGTEERGGIKMASPPRSLESACALRTEKEEDQPELGKKGGKVLVARSCLVGEMITNIGEGGGRNTFKSQGEMGGKRAFAFSPYSHVCRRGEEYERLSKDTLMHKRFAARHQKREEKRGGFRHRGASAGLTEPR